MAPPLDGLSDALLRLGRSRDPEAWGLVVERCQGAVGRLAQRLAGDAALAADAEQEAWLQVRDGAARYAPRGDHPDAGAWCWVLRVATNASLQLVRRRERPGRPGPEPEAEAAGDPLVRLEQATAVRQALARLPEAQRTAVVLHHIEGLTFPAIAAALGCRTVTAKVRAHRGLNALRRHLDPAVGAPAVLAGLGPPPGTPTTPALDPNPLLTAPLAPAGLAPAVAGGTTMAIIAACAACALTAGLVALAPAPSTPAPSPAPVAAGPATAAAVATTSIDPEPPNDDGGAIATGFLGPRQEGSRVRAVARLGGSRGSLLATGRAVTWLVGQQQADGGWDARATARACGDAEPALATSAEESAVILTSQVLLCLLADGRQPAAPGAAAEPVRRGLARLRAGQDDGGRFAQGLHAHALATLAWCDAYAQSGDQKLRQPAERAVAALRTWLRTSNGTALAPRDVISSTWADLALKHALVAGLNIDGDLLRVRDKVAATWLAANDGSDGRPDHRTLDEQGRSLWPRINPTASPTTLDGGPVVVRGTESQGLLLALMLGLGPNPRPGPDGAMVPTLVNAVLADADASVQRLDTCTLFFATHAFFQLGSDNPRWLAWNRLVRDRLVAAQDRTPPARDGSWAWHDGDTPEGAGCRLLATARACQTLQVYHWCAQVYGPNRLYNAKATTSAATRSAF